MCSGLFSLGFALKRDRHPLLEELDQLHVIGRVEAHLAVVKATFTPTLFVLFLQLCQLVPCTSENRLNKTTDSVEGCNM